MKWIRIIGHPLTLMVIFPCLLIEGDKFVMPYAFYLWFSLSTGATYTIPALAGLVVLYAGYQVSLYKVIIKTVLYVAGLLLLLLSLYNFFGNGDKSGSFEQTIPLLSFILFFISVLCFLINTVAMLARLSNENTQQV